MIWEEKLKTVFKMVAMVAILISYAKGVAFKYVKMGEEKDSINTVLNKMVM